NAFGIEAQFDGFQQFEAHIPVVGGVYPGAHNKIHRGVGQFGNGDAVGRVFQHFIVAADDVIQQVFGFQQVAAVADAHHQVDAAGTFFGIVGHGVAENITVRHGHHFVVRSFQASAENADVIHRTGAAADFHVVTQLERTEHNQHDAGGKVGEGIFQRQTNGQTGGTDQSDQ